MNGRKTVKLVKFHTSASENLELGAGEWLGSRVQGHYIIDHDRKMTTSSQWPAVTSRDGLQQEEIIGKLENWRLTNCGDLSLGRTRSGLQLDFTRILSPGLAAAPHLAPNHTNKVTPTLFLPLLTFPDQSFYCHWYLLGGALSRQRAPITSYHSVTSSQSHHHRSEYKWADRSTSSIKKQKGLEMYKRNGKSAEWLPSVPTKHAAAARSTLPVSYLPCSWILNVKRTVWDSVYLCSQ